MIVIMMAALALQASTPAQSDSKAAPAKSGQTADKSKTSATQDDPNKKTCRRQTPVGSTIEQRICKTKAEWDAEEQSAQTLRGDAVQNFSGGLVGR